MELEMLFKSEINQILFGIKDCFSKLCRCERAGVHGRGRAEPSRAAGCQSCLANCHLIMRVNWPGNKTQPQIY